VLRFALRQQLVQTGSAVASEKTAIKVEGKRMELSNLSKVFYPKFGFTKGQVIDYFVRAAPVLLPHLQQRPISLKRYPDGVEGQYFFEKQCPSHRPKWMSTYRVESHREQGYIDYCLINDLPSLVWAANLADLELHTFLHRAPKIMQPDFLAFDLDPGPPADIITCCAVALRLKAFFDQISLESFPKTSGSKGIQVYVPLNTKVSYDQTKAFAHAIAQEFASQLPDLVVSKMQKNLRTGKVLVDWSQNDDHKTTICVYSLRARERPTVSTPVTWQEIADAKESGKPEDLSFESDAVLQRIERMGDLFEPVLKLKQKLPRLKL
jgi:bifunctional non-homologous end joining protein LigD